MKKLTNLCIAVIALVGLSFSAYADGQSPVVGATHTYTVDSHVGSTYIWFVSTDFQGDLDAGAVVTLADEDTNNASITWVNPDLARTDPYFVHVIETANGCSNHKVMAVIPANGFALAIASVNDAGDIITADADIKKCAPDAAVTGYNSGTDTFTYDYKTNTFYYKISATGIGTDTDWNPHFKIGLTSGTAVATWGATIAGATTLGLTTNNVSNEGVVVNTGLDIYVKVIVSNTEGLNENPVVITLVDTAGTSEDEFGHDVTSITGPSIQTVKARPTINGITTN